MLLLYTSFDFPKINVLPFYTNSINVKSLNVRAIILLLLQISLYGIAHIFSIVNWYIIYEIYRISFCNMLWNQSEWVALYWITQSIQYWYYSCIISSYILYVIPFYGWLSFDRLADVLDKNEIIIVRRIYTSCFVKYHAYVVYETLYVQLNMFG